MINIFSLIHLIQGRWMKAWTGELLRPLFIGLGKAAMNRYYRVYPSDEVEELYPSLVSGLMNRMIAGPAGIWEERAT